MKTLVLSNRDLQHLIAHVGVDSFMDEVIARLSDALLTFDPLETQIPERTGFYYEQPATGLIEWMPLWQKRHKVLMKVVGYHPHSPALHDMPTIVSTLSCYDVRTGHLEALIDGTLLTAMRTGAASAIASRALARPDSTTLGLVGCGAQAVTQLHAISRLFDIRDVLIHDNDGAATESLAERTAAFLPSTTSIRIEPCAEVLAGADIICVATCVEVGAGPVVEDGAMQPWLHINAVGSDLPGKTELPKSLLQKSFVCPDNPSQALVEGECQQLAADEIGAGLVEVLRRSDEFRWAQAQRTVFDSTGWALEDQVAMELTLESAAELGLGTTIEIECLPEDPKDPYEFLTSKSDSHPHMTAVGQLISSVR